MRGVKLVLVVVALVGLVHAVSAEEGREKEQGFLGNLFFGQLESACAVLVEEVVARDRVMSGTGAAVLVRDAGNNPKGYISSALASPRERPYTRTKAAHGTACMNASK
jgi:hypothetical protein